MESNDECQYILDELVTIMSTLDPTATPYSSKHLKRKLKDQYGEFITITEVAGKSGVVCFSGCMNSILTNQWYTEREENAADEVKRVIHTAAMLIRREIRSRVYNCEVFPSAEQIASGNSELVPDTLRLQIDGILKPATPDNKKHERKSVTIQHAIVAAVRPRSFMSPLQVPDTLQLQIDGILKPATPDNKKQERKSVTIQHAIVAAVRPRSFMSPLQVGLGIHLHREYGSRVLIDMLSNIGLCASYSEVTNYEASITTNAQAMVDKGAYIQFVFDNADYNVSTLDGHRTFHAMGGIKCVTPADKVHADAPVPRTGSSNPEAVGSHGITEVKIYHQPMTPGYSLLKAENIRTLSLESDSVGTSRRLDALWMSGTWLQILPRPGWSGYMSKMHSSNTEYSTSAVLPLPFVNMDPNNLSTIYTCLQYVA